MYPYVLARIRRRLVKLSLVVGYRYRTLADPYMQEFPTCKTVLVGAPMHACSSRAIAPSHR